METRIRVQRAAIGACSIFLAGCHLFVNEQWDPEPKWPRLDTIHRIEVSQSELEGVCGDSPGVYLFGCARRDYVARVCLIYTTPDPEEWLIRHEKRHCEGWDHGTAPKRLLDPPRTDGS